MTHLSKAGACFLGALYMLCSVLAFDVAREVQVCRFPGNSAGLQQLTALGLATAWPATIVAAGAGVILFGTAGTYECVMHKRWPKP